MLTVTIVNNQVRIQVWLHGDTPSTWVIYTPDQVDELIKQLELARDAARSTDQA